MASERPPSPAPNEPRPIKRLEESLVNRIAAGEVRLINCLNHSQSLNTPTMAMILACADYSQTGLSSQGTH